eukprot:1385026-Amorphochlora_amoeboformis.AAC.1
MHTSVNLTPYQGQGFGENWISFRVARRPKIVSTFGRVGSAAEGLEGSISPSNMTLHSLGDQSKVHITPRYIN